MNAKHILNMINKKEEMLFNLSVEHHEYDYFKIYEHYKKYVKLIK